MWGWEIFLEGAGGKSKSNNVLLVATKQETDKQRREEIWYLHGDAMANLRSI